METYARDSKEDLDDLRIRREYDRSTSIERKYKRYRSPSTDRMSTSRSVYGDRYSRRKSSKEREYDWKSMQSFNNGSNSLHSNAVHQTATLPFNTMEQMYSMQYAGQGNGNVGCYTGYQQVVEYKNKANDSDTVDEELMKEIKDIFSDDDEDADQGVAQLPLPERTSMSAMTYGQTSSGSFEAKPMFPTCPRDKYTRSYPSSEIPAKLCLKIQSQLARINNIKLLQERIQNRSEPIYMALINHWKSDAEEIYKSFNNEHAFLEVNWPNSQMNHEYFSRAVYNQMYSAYSSIMINLADMEQGILKTTEQGDSDSYPWILLTNYLDQLDHIPPQIRNDPSSLNTIISSCVKVRNDIQSLVQREHLGDGLLIHRMTQLLDRPTREAWNDSLGNSKQLPTFEEFNIFLVKRVRDLEITNSVLSTRNASPSMPSRTEARMSVLKRIDPIPRIRKTSPSASSRRVARVRSRSPIRRTRFERSGSKETIYNNKITQRISKYPCAYCMKHHFILVCPLFRQLFPEERREYITEKRLCFNCFGQHLAKYCKSNGICKKCGSNHHTMIHDDSYFIKD